MKKLHPIFNGIASVIGGIPHVSPEARKLGPTQKKVQNPGNFWDDHVVAGCSQYVGLDAV